MKAPIAARPLPPVYATVAVETAGVRESKTVRMFEKLPAGWSRKTETERLHWLKEYFRGAANLTPDQKLVHARCP